MATVSDSLIKDILRSKEQKIANIHEKMQYLYKEMQNTGEILHATALPATRIDGMSGSKGNHYDLGDVLLNYKKRLYERSLETRKLMWRLSDEEEMISRIWACFCALDDPFYNILHQLYVESRLYSAVEMESGMSHKTFEKNRKIGIRLIQKYYESGESIADLMQHEKYVEKKNRGKGTSKADTEEYSQIELTAYLKEESG